MISPEELRVLSGTITRLLDAYEDAVMAARNGLAIIAAREHQVGVWETTVEAHRVVIGDLEAEAALLRSALEQEVAWHERNDPLMREVNDIASRYYSRHIPTPQISVLDTTRRRGALTTTPNAEAVLRVIEAAKRTARGDYAMKVHWQQRLQEALDALPEGLR